MAAAFVWMRYPETGGVNRFPQDAAPQWQARGWELCDPPAETPWREDPRYVDLPAPKPAPAKPAASKTPAPAGDPKKEKADG
ncbi:MAG TPA: hypothetical protein VFM50_06575 [Nocardioidaceae bacterium]|nr:hypothetical protein [Nocardioidaceae bacterium]